MAGYQAGIEKFTSADTEVFGLSTDNTPSLGVFAKQLNLQFPLLSDFMRKTSADYGILMPDRGIANRATFIIGMDGRVTYIEEGSTAVNIDGAATACSRLKKKA